jgi:MoaA/NifB/PqqE/SkfB family radical SAM enzyme
MCFYWQNIESREKKDELTLDEIKRIAPRFDNLFQLTISGGEPLLRDDCFDIVSVFCEHTPVRRVTLTTNGSLPEKISEFVREFCSRYPQVILSVNLSIDGLKDTHDRIRGVKGSFEKMLESFDLLSGMMKKYGNLKRATATTISTINQEEMPELMDFIERRMDISSHGLMLARGAVRNKNISKIDYKKFRSAIVAFEKKASYKRGIIMNAILNTYEARRLGSIETRKMLDKCRAGGKLIIMDEGGQVLPCELLEVLRQRRELKEFEGDFSLGNIREHDYDIGKILRSAKAEKVRKFIRDDGCWCTFECAMINNFLLNPVNYLRVIKNALLPRTRSIVR